MKYLHIVIGRLPRMYEVMVGKKSQCFWHSFGSKELPSAHPSPVAAQLPFFVLLLKGKTDLSVSKYFQQQKKNKILAWCESSPWLINDTVSEAYLSECWDPAQLITLQPVGFVIFHLQLNSKNNNNSRLIIILEYLFEKFYKPCIEILFFYKPRIELFRLLGLSVLL